MSMNQMYPPLPLLSFHIDPPWKSEVTKASAIGEIAKSKPARINGNLFMGTS